MTHVQTKWTILQQSDKNNVDNLHGDYGTPAPGVCSAVTCKKIKQKMENDKYEVCKRRKHKMNNDQF